jgi:hypothetical protein
MVNGDKGNIEDFQIEIELTKFKEKGENEMRNKIKKIGLGLIAALMIPTSAFASGGQDYPEKGGSVMLKKQTELPSYLIDNSQISVMASGWQTLFDMSDIYFSSTYKTTPTYTSDGGDFRACVYEMTVAGVNGAIEFWESDPGTNDDDFIGWGHFINNQCVVASVGSYADGDNNKPEIYVTVGAVVPSTYARLVLQD